MAVNETTLTGIATPGSLVAFHNDQGEYLGSAKADSQGLARLPIADIDDNLSTDNPQVEVVTTANPVAVVKENTIEGVAAPGSLVVFKDDQGEVIGSAIADEQGQVRLALDTPITGKVTPNDR